MSATTPIKPQDVGWQFVPQYYNFVNSQPHRLHCFYNKRSTFIHGEEGEDVAPAYGQQEIHDRITQIGYNQCKVYIHSMDSQSSADGGIVIMVLGELCNNNQAWRKFSQTFFLAPQTGGYFVLNDIFRYLNEEVDESKSEDGQQEEVQAEPEAPKAAVEEPPATEEKVTQEPAAEPVPEPEPVSAPAAVVPDAVPEEAEIAALPDKDVAPTEEAAPEEPATAANPSVEKSPAPAPVSEKTPSPAPKAPSPAPAPKKAAPTNGTSAPAAPAPAPAPAGPPKPRTWATLAASNIPPTSTWGKPSPAVSAQASPSAAAAPVPAAPKKEEQKPAPAPAATAAPAPRRGPQGGFDVSKIQNQVCFVKLPNWALDNHSASELSEPELSKLASKFGEVKSVEIVGQKACAFVEFAKVEYARKAIQHSLPVEQGGEGGTKFPNGTLFFEPRKEKDERGQKKRPGQQGGQPQGQGQPRQQVNGGAGRGGRPNRGRGGQANQGDRAPQKQ